jgi:diketogulonate reductase-like aldo/keto reductase
MCRAAAAPASSLSARVASRRKPHAMPFSATPEIPPIGFGTFPLTGEAAREAVLMAIGLGYRHIDTAQMYGNEREVGAAVERCGVPRTDLFLVTKVDPANVSADRFLSSVDRSLERLSTDRVDLLLLHWPPSAEPLEAVLDRLEEARDSGRARAVGVSNFTPAQMRLAAGRLHIAMNQVEFHPFLDQSALLREARRLGVRLAAYCPLARGAVIGHPVVADVARRHGRTDAQIVLRWIVQQGVAAVAMSTKPANAASNLDIFGFDLSDRDMERIGALGAEGRRLVAPAGLAPDRREPERPMRNSRPGGPP